jgi:hypothetical protein
LASPIQMISAERVRALEPDDFAVSDDSPDPRPPTSAASQRGGDHKSSRRRRDPDHQPSRFRGWAFCMNGVARGLRSPRHPEAERSRHLRVYGPPPDRDARLGLHPTAPPVRHSPAAGRGLRRHSLHREPTLPRACRRFGTIDAYFADEVLRPVWAWGSDLRRPLRASESGSAMFSALRVPGFSPQQHRVGRRSHRASAARGCAHAERPAFRRGALACVTVFGRPNSPYRPFRGPRPDELVPSSSAARRPWPLW